MAVRDAVLAGTFVALALGSPGTAVAAVSAEAAYVEALQALNRIRAERQSADERLERARDERDAVQEDLDRRRGSAMAELERLMREKSAALDAFLRMVPSANAALDQANAELEQARRAIIAAEERLDQRRTAVVEAQSASSVLKVKIDRAKARIDENRTGIEQERTRIQRIGHGDPGELDELARRAVQESEDVAAILREFSPSYEAAQQTARIALGVHLPALYKAKQSIEQIRTNFCGAYTGNARRHIEYALKGVEAFLQESSAAGRYFELAMKAEPREEDATCSLDLAQAGINEAKAQIALREQAIAENETVVATASAQLASAMKILAGARDGIAQDEQAVHMARAALERLERDSAGRRAAWSAEIEAQRAERAVREQALRDEAEEARRNYEAALVPFEAEAATLASLDGQAGHVAELTKRLGAAELDAGRKRKAFLRDLVHADVRRLLKANVRTYQDHGDKEVCAWFENSSSFAVKALTLDVTLAGKPLPGGVVFKPRFSTDSREILRIPAAGKDVTEVSVDWNTGAINFEKTNRYSEKVPYLMPGAKSRSVCTHIERLFEGYNLRILEADGLDRAPLSRFGIHIASFHIADGSVSPDSPSAGRLPPVDLVGHYRIRLEQVEARAAAEAVESDGRGDSALIPAATDKARRIEVQQVLIGAGLLTGKADGIFGERSKEAIRNWQKAKGYPATGELTAAQMAVLLHKD
jgi:hypothetical protein